VNIIASDFSGSALGESLEIHCVAPGTCYEIYKHSLCDAGAVISASGDLIENFGTDIVDSPRLPSNCVEKIQKIANRGEG
jgi:hypothetical protein